MTLPYELISDAVEQTNDRESFFEFLEERASHTELVDITDEDFRATMESYKNRTADFVGRSDEVMSSLITTVAKEVDDPVLSSYIEETQSTEEHTADDVAESPADTIEEIARKVHERD